MHAYRNSIIDAVNKVAAGTWTESLPTSSLNDTRAPMSGRDAICYSADDFPDYGAVDPGTVSSLADEVYEAFRDKFLSADTSDKCTKSATSIACSTSTASLGSKAATRLG